MSPTFIRSVAGNDLRPYFPLQATIRTACEELGGTSMVSPFLVPFREIGVLARQLMSLISLAGYRF